MHSCTAFSINQRSKLYLTAYHCTQPFMSDSAEAEVPMLDGQPLAFAFKDESRDLAILVGPIARPALFVRERPLLVGDPVGSYGYGYGMLSPMFRLANVSVFVKDPQGLDWMLLDNALIGGMSGGPIVDSQGRLVGVNARSDYMTGFSLSLKQIQAVTQFWPDEAQP